MNFVQTVRPENPISERTKKVAINKTILLEKGLLHLLLGNLISYSLIIDQKTLFTVLVVPLNRYLVYRKPQLTKKLATREGMTWIKWRGF